jgi:hypothetical protein
VRRAVDEALETRGDLIDRVASRALDPYSAADELVAVITSARASK